MGNFLSSILSRHVSTVEKVLPRLPGNFEHGHKLPGNEIQDISETAERLNPPDPIADFPNTIGQRNLTPKQPFVGEKPGTFLKETMEELHQDIEPPTQRKHEPQPNSLINELESKDFNPGFQGLHHSKSSDNAELSAGPTDFETHSEPTVAKDTMPLTRLQVIDLFTTQQPSSANEIVQQERVQANPGDYGKPIFEIKGTLGDPPGRGNPYDIKGMQGTHDFRTEPKPSPVIKVNIGQIHVRAITPPPAVTSQKPRQAHKPVLTLEEYLKGRG